MSKTEQELNEEQAKAILTRTSRKGGYLKKSLDNFYEELDDDESKESLTYTILQAKPLIQRAIEAGDTAERSMAKAIQFIAFIVNGYSKTEAYKKTWPATVNKITEQLLLDGKDKKAIEKAIVYKANVQFKKKLVQDVYQTTIVPAWLLNINNYQEAINVQVNLMQNAKSETVRTNAANSVLQHLKAPDTVEEAVQEKMNDEGLDILNKLKEASDLLVKQQKLAIESKQVPITDIIEGDIV